MERSSPIRDWISGRAASTSSSALPKPTGSRQRTVSDEYVEDSTRLVMGRYAMFSVKWNFGKMNPAKNARVRNAMYNMML